MSRSPRGLGRKTRLTVESLESRLVLSSIVVQNLNDAGAGSLRDAIAQANLDPALDAIHFAPGLSGVIALASPLPEVASTLVIAGPGRQFVEISPTSLNDRFTLATISDRGSALVRDLTFTGGGGVVNNGVLAMTSVTVQGNQGKPPWEAGGGLFNNGTMTLVDSLISSNCMDDYLSGIRSSGGISNTGVMSIQNSQIIGNTGYDDGGGVWNTGELSIDQSWIGNNFVSDDFNGGGGGIYNSGRLLVTNTTISGNEVLWGRSIGQGAGLYNSGFAVLQSVLIHGNHEAGEGGGIANHGQLLIQFSRITENSSQSYVWSGGGGIYNGEGASMAIVATSIERNQAGGSYNASYGGGIYNAGLMTIHDALVNENTADYYASGIGGGIYNEGPLIIVNSTIRDNRAALASDGIYSTGNLSLQFVTMSAGRKPDAYLPAGWLVSIRPSATVSAVNSIFDAQGGPSVVTNGTGRFVSLGHNLYSDRPSVAIDSTDLVDTNPMISTLGDYGGRTWTMGLLADSPALGGGTFLDDVTADQRGLPRLKDGPIDIGAYQAQRPPVVIPPAPPPPAPPPPVVIGVQRQGVRREPTSLTVSFSQAMDETRAGNVNAYRLATPGRDRRFGTDDDGVVPIASASYDPGSFTTTLRLARLLPLRGSFRLTVMGTAPNGLTDAQGLFLDGAGNRQPGSDYVARINSWNLTPPIHRAPPRWARRV